MNAMETPANMSTELGYVVRNRGAGRKAEFEAIRKAYGVFPDSTGEAGDWSNAEEYAEQAGDSVSSVDDSG